MTQIPFNIEHCGHCALRSKGRLEGESRCYIFNVKDVTENVETKTVHEDCPLKKAELIFKLKK